MASTPFSFSNADVPSARIGRHRNALTMLEAGLEQIQRPQRRWLTSQSWEQPTCQPQLTHQGTAGGRSRWYVTIRDLHKSYGNRRALNGLSLKLSHSSIYGLLGPNGAGKSTTLQILSTLLAPDGGSVQIGDIDALKHPRRARASMGYVGQECALDKILTGREHLYFHADLHHLSDEQMHARAGELIEQLKMSDWVDRRCGSYSGGMKRRLDLACGLMHEPSLLILDEPTAGLDIESRTAIWQLLRQLRSQGTSILLSSHYIEEIEALSDRVGIIEAGTILAEGHAEDLKKSLGSDHLCIRLQEFTPRNQAEQAAELIHSCKGVRSLVIDNAQGNSLHIAIDNPGSIETIKQRLDQAGVPLFSLSQSQASLNDLYLHATGRNLCDADQRASAQRDLKKERRKAMR